MPYEGPAKFGLKAPTVQVASKAITDFDVSRFDDLLAAGTDGGIVSYSAHHKSAGCRIR